VSAESDGWVFLAALLGTVAGTPTEEEPGLPPVGSVGLTWRELADSIGLHGATLDTFGREYVRIRAGLSAARRHAKGLGMGLTIPRPIQTDDHRYRLALRGSSTSSSLGAGFGWTVALDDAASRVRTVVEQNETILARTDLDPAEKLTITRSVAKVQGMLLVLEDEVATLRTTYPA